MERRLKVSKSALVVSQCNTAIETANRTLETTQGLLQEGSGQADDSTTNEHFSQTLLTVSEDNPMPLLQQDSEECEKVWRLFQRDLLQQVLPGAALEVRPQCLAATLGKAPEMSTSFPEYSDFSDDHAWPEVIEPGYERERV